MFTDCSSLEDIIASCESNIDLFEETATECVKENGYNYSVNACMLIKRILQYKRI